MYIYFSKEKVLQILNVRALRSWKVLCNVLATAFTIAIIIQKLKCLNVKKLDDNFRNNIVTVVQ